MWEIGKIRVTFGKVSANITKNIFPKYLLWYLHEIAQKNPREKKYSSSFYDSVAKNLQFPFIFSEALHIWFFFHKKSQTLWTKLKTVKGSSPNYFIPYYTTFNLTQTGATLNWSNGERWKFAFWEFTPKSTVRRLSVIFQSWQIWPLGFRCFLRFATLTRNFLPKQPEIYGFSSCMGFPATLLPHHTLKRFPLGNVSGCLCLSLGS